MSQVIDLNGIPQFMRDPEGARQYFQEFGFYVELENGLSSVECDQLIAAAQDFENFKSGKCSPLMMPHRTDSRFLEAMKNRKIVALAQGLIGGKVHGMQSEFFFCRPGTRGFALHQDNYFVEAENGEMISAWTPLVDVNRDRGCLIVFPRSHKAGILPTRKLSLGADEGQDPHANDQEVIMPEGFEAVDLEMPRGSILFIHSQIVHGSNRNQTDQFRYVLLNTYIKDGVKFRPGRYAQRAAVDLEFEA